jgi:hypothetical protein
MGFIFIFSLLVPFKNYELVVHAAAREIRNIFEKRD